MTQSISEIIPSLCALGVNKQDIFQKFVLTNSWKIKEFAFSVCLTNITLQHATVLYVLIVDFLVIRKTNAHTADKCKILN
jgi:hypothetical protein